MVEVAAGASSLSLAVLGDQVGVSWIDQGQPYFRLVKADLDGL